MRSVEVATFRSSALPSPPMFLSLGIELTLLIDDLTLMSGRFSGMKRSDAIVLLILIYPFKFPSTDGIVNSFPPFIGRCAFSAVMDTGTYHVQLFIKNMDFFSARFSIKFRLW